ncbi:MAG: hypothetical protein L0L37_00780, partial [Lacticaseibacillus paracasei]|nr:hypothetical protein [Lacticaseibacillus paracasei]
TNQLNYLCDIDGYHMRITMNRRLFYDRRCANFKNFQSDRIKINAFNQKLGSISGSPLRKNAKYCFQQLAFSLG